jgi:hypothetical protein
VFERRRTYRSAYLHKEPCRDDEIKLGLRWLTEQGVGGELLVLVPGKRNIEYSSVLRALQGRARIETEATFKRNHYGWRGGPAMAVWPSPKQLALIDDHAELKALVAVPWNLADLGDWIRARRPVDLLGVAPTAPEPTISDAVVRVALEHLTSAVNLGTGLHHPSDKAHAVRTFELLRENGHHWTGDEVHAWALAHGWENDGASDLRRYAEGIREGKTFRTERYGLGPETIARWREEAAQTD